MCFVFNIWKIIFWKIIFEKFVIIEILIWVIICFFFLKSKFRCSAFLKYINKICSMQNIISNSIMFFIIFSRFEFSMMIFECRIKMSAFTLKNYEKFKKCYNILKLKILKLKRVKTQNFKSIESILQLWLEIWFSILMKCFYDSSFAW